MAEETNETGTVESSEVEVADKQGIKETKDVVVLLAKIGVSVSQCAIAKKFSLAPFMDDLMVVPAAIEDITKVWAEIKDIDVAESEELINAVLTELAPLGLTDKDAAMHFVNAGKYFILGTVKIIEGVKAL